jgi:hypothetical protein
MAHKKIITETSTQQDSPETVPAINVTNQMTPKIQQKKSQWTSIFYLFHPEAVATK